MKGFVELGDPIPADGQPPEGVEPGVRPLDGPAENPQAAAVRAAATGDRAVDAPRTKLVTVLPGVIAAVGQQPVRTSLRPPGFALHRRHRIDQRDKLGHVVPVGSGDRDDQRDAATIGQQVAFGAALAAVRGVRTGF